MKLRHQAAAAGAVLLTARDSAGRKLFGLPDGSLAFLTEDREDGTEIVIVQAGPVGQCLAEAPGGSLRIDPAAKPVMILPLRTTVYGPDTLLQDVAGTQLLVSPDGMVVASTDETYDVGVSR